MMIDPYYKKWMLDFQGIPQGLGPPTIFPCLKPWPISRRPWNRYPKRIARPYIPPRINVHVACYGICPSRPRPWRKMIEVGFGRGDTVDGWNPVNSPVEVGSWNPIIYQGFSTIPTVVGCLRFLNHQHFFCEVFHPWIFQKKHELVCGKEASVFWVRKLGILKQLVPRVGFFWLRFFWMWVVVIYVYTVFTVYIYVWLYVCVENRGKDFGFWLNSADSQITQAAIHSVTIFVIPGNTQASWTTFLSWCQNFQVFH